MKPRQQRERFVVILSALYAVGKGRNVESWLPFTSDSVRPGRRFLEELFIHLSLILGFPTMIDGLEKLSRLYPPNSQLPKSTNARNGLAILRRVYGDQTKKLLTNLRALHPELPAWVVKDVYGKVFSRRGMSLRERELCNVVVLSFQNLEKQLRSHIRGAQRAGMSLPDLRKALLLAQRVTGRRELRAIELLRPVVSQKKKT
ncbi:MAG: carboxymuconolactone decarboxylase family protein [Bacteroidota bacterium]